MKTDAYIVSHHHLHSTCRSKIYTSVKLTDLKAKYHTEAELCSIVLFVDKTSGKSKLLKNRFGDNGVIVKS